MHPMVQSFKEVLQSNKCSLSVSGYEKPKIFNFPEQYNRILSQIRDTSGKSPDLVIVDSLQGLLPPNCEDHKLKRGFANQVAETVATTALNMKHVAILIARGNNSCENSDDFTANDTADSGQLSEHMSGVLGITKLEEIDRTKEDIISGRQKLMVLKSPCGQTDQIAFDRHFDKTLLADINL
jgi:hypothetical protein